MYESFFSMRTRAFPSVARPDLYVPVAAIEEARRTAFRVIHRGEGLALVIGPSGTGKTLLCQVLAQQLAEEMDVVMLSSGRLGTRRALLQAILYHLRRPYRGMDENELRLALTGYVTSGQSKPDGIALLVDEAHTLPLRLLDELRMLGNLAADGQPRVRLLLAGIALLEERIANPRLDSFAQRVTARCYLEPLNRTETRDYIDAQIAMAGGQSGEVFLEDACQAVYRATDGVPRLVNQVCDHAMFLAYAAGRRRIDTRDVEDAWADLQQLPARRSESSGVEGPADVIEFGSLEDAASTPEATVVVDDLQPTAADGPAEQIDEIADMVARLDDDFRPAGSIRPEVEIRFDGPLNLLAEPFEEEEVVCDRYSGTVRVRPKPDWDTPEDVPFSVAVSAPRFERAAAVEPQTVMSPIEIAPVEMSTPVAVASETFAPPAAVIQVDYNASPQIRTLKSDRKPQYRQLFARLRRG